MFAREDYVEEAWRIVDPLLQIDAQDVALTGPYQGTRRMTLTYPIINRARQILWVVSGAEKALSVARLRAGDAGIPTGQVRQDNAILLADRAAVNGCLPHP